jgi:hypothetical protein
MSSATIPGRVDGPQRLRVGVHEALHPQQRVQDGDMLRLHVLPPTKRVNPRSVPDFGSE